MNNYWYHKLNCLIFYRVSQIGNELSAINSFLIGSNVDIIKLVFNNVFLLFNKNFLLFPA